MLEDQLRLSRQGRGQPGEDELSFLEDPQGHVDGVVGQVREQRDGGGPEDSADHRGCLKDPLVLTVQEVEARRQDRLHRVGDHDSLDVVDGAPSIALANEVPLVDQLAHDLLQEEGVAFGPLEDPGVHRRREVVDREQLVHESVRLLRRKRIERYRRMVPSSASPCWAGRGQVRPRGTDEEHRSNHALR